jgi:hypothetical protein
LWNFYIFGETKNKQMKKYFGLVVLSVSVAFTACKKETIDDGGVTPENVYGCTDENAENYNPDATDSDGSCEYSTSYLMSGEWNISHLAYETEVDLTEVNALLGIIPVEGEAEEAGTFTLIEEDATYVSDLSFTTEPITVLTFEIPGFPINLPSEGSWTLSEDEEYLYMTDNVTSAIQEYEVVNVAEDFMLLRGVVTFSQEVPTLGEYEFEVELDLTLEK